MIHSTRIWRELFRKRLMQVTFGVILLLPFIIGLCLLYKSLPLLSPAQLLHTIFGSDWSPMRGLFGLWPFIFSSIIISLISLLIVIPVALGSAIFITQFAPRWISGFLRSVIDILAGIPSVIFGLWGVLTVVPLVARFASSFGAANATGYSILAGGMVAAVSVVPFVLNMLLELFTTVSMELKESAFALGASHWQVVKDVVLRKLKPGIAAAFTLGVSKAFGETIAVLMVVGNIVQIPGSLFDAGYPLPALLANNYGEMMTIPQYDAALMLSALMLLLIVIAFNYAAHQVIHFYQSKI